jgi:putative tricarboxylic transport membrane protein
MALDRWIALVILASAAPTATRPSSPWTRLLPPFMQRNPIWPSTFPKVLAVLGA